MDASGPTRVDRLAHLTEIGISLSAEKDIPRLMERILESAKELTNSDGGSLYLRDDDNHLVFEIMLTDSLNIRLGGTSGEHIRFKPLPLYDALGKANHHMVAAHAALEGGGGRIRGRDPHDLQARTDPGGLHDLHPGGDADLVEERGRPEPVLDAIGARDNRRQRQISNRGSGAIARQRGDVDHFTGPVDPAFRRDEDGQAAAWP